MRSNHLSYLALDIVSNQLLDTFPTPQPGFFRGCKYKYFFFLTGTLFPFIYYFYIA